MEVLGSADWREMSSAPRDGSIVEIKNMEGGVSWSGLFRWTDELTVWSSETVTDENGYCERDLGTQVYVLRAPTWVAVSTPGTAVSREDHLRWKPVASN